MLLFISSLTYTGDEMSLNSFEQFCNSCGIKLVNGNCSNCFINRNALIEFEMEDD